MIVAGCDIGSLTSKAVLIQDGKIMASVVIKSKPKPWESADAVMDQVLSQMQLDRDTVALSVGTGYGRDKIPFVSESLSEIACHARGARWLMPAARTVIDIGGQDCKAIRLDRDGRLEKFTANDKCASGTGRFLEVMARVLGLRLEELGPLSLKASNPITLASACTVWAQADVIKHLNDGVPIEGIAAGVNNAMANRMAVLVRSVGIEKEVCMTGGVAKNRGVLLALEKLLGIRIRPIRRADPQIVGAIGAALYAQDRLNGGGA